MTFTHQVLSGKTLSHRFWILFSSLLLIAGTGYKAQSQTTYDLIGAGGVEDAWNRNQYPIVVGNTCSRATQLYTKTKLNTAGLPSSGTVELSKIAWRPDLDNVSIQGTLTIYLKNTNLTGLASSSWDVNGAVTVFNGTVNHTTIKDEWWEVPFTTNFTWNNTDNLQVLVEFTRTNSQGNPGNLWNSRSSQNEPANTVAFNNGTTCPATLTATFSPNNKFYDTRFTTAGASPLTVGTITATQQTLNVTRGSVKQAVLRVDIPVSGSVGTLTLNSLTVTPANTNNADIAPAGVKLWAGTTLAVATAIGTAQNVSSTVTFSGLSQSISSITTLWITYDIASGATLGNFVDAQIAAGNISISASGGANAPGTQPVTTLNPAGNRKIDYCDDLYSNGCMLSGINDVSIGTSGSVLNHTGTGCTGGTRFADFTSLPNINMSAGQTYPFSILNVQATFVESGLGIWMDFNKNGSYGDAGEFLGSAYGRSTSNGLDFIPYTGNIVIPAVPTGSYRMRIKLTDNLPQDLGTSCQKDNGGETHDYVVNITGGATCTSPNGTATFGAFTNVTTTSTTANVTYTNGSNPASGYALLRSTVNTTPVVPVSGTAVPSAGSTTFVSGYTVVGTTTTLGSAVPFSSTGLSAGTTYYYWVVAYQNTNGPCWFTPSPQSANSQATTPQSCTPPTAAISGNTTGCGNVTLTAGGGNTYSWSGGTSPSAATNTFNASGTYTVTVTDAINCSASASVSVTVNEKPAITLGAAPSVIQGATIADLPYTITAGNPDQYRLDWDATALAQGFANQNYTSLPASPIVITVPPAAAPGTYNAGVTVRNSTSSCVSDSLSFTVTISVATGLHGAESNSGKCYLLFINPVQDNILVLQSSDNLQGLPLTLHSALGQLAMSQIISNSRMQIDVSALPAGVYLLQAGEVAKKLVIRR